jgi:hypothetical protein
MIEVQVRVQAHVPEERRRCLVARVRRVEVVRPDVVAEHDVVVQVQVQVREALRWRHHSSPFAKRGKREQSSGDVL